MPVQTSGRRLSAYSHGPHVVLWQQRDLQDLGVVVVQRLVARRGHRLAGDAVDLVEGVRPQQPVVGRADEQLQGQRLALHVAVELGREKERRSCGEAKNNTQKTPLACREGRRGSSRGQHLSGVGS